MTVFTAAGSGPPPTLETPVDDGVWIDTTSGEIWKAEEDGWASLGNLNDPDDLPLELKYRVGLEQDPDLVEVDPTVEL